MKTKTLILSTSAVLTALSSGYTVSLQNFNAGDATAVPIVDNTGTPIPAGGGFIGAGTFATAPTSVTESRDITLFGSGLNGFSNGLVGPDGVLAGFFSNSFSDPIPEGTTTPPVGERLYVVMGNGATLADSTQFAILDTGQTFGTENAAGSGGLDVILTSSSLNPEALAVGTVLESYDYTGVATFDEAIQLAPIPEPSTSLLAALAGLGLVARRRR